MKNLTTKKTIEDGGTKIQLDFFFWLGADGEIASVSEEEFNEAQEKWDGVRPTNRND